MKVEMGMVKLLRENTTLFKLGYPFNLPFDAPAEDAAESTRGTRFTRGKRDAKEAVAMLQEAPAIRPANEEDH